MMQVICEIYSVTRRRIYQIMYLTKILKSLVMPVVSILLPYVNPALTWKESLYVKYLATDSTEFPYQFICFTQNFSNLSL